MWGNAECGNFKNEKSAPKNPRESMFQTCGMLHMHPSNKMMGEKDTHECTRQDVIDIVEGGNSVQDMNRRCTHALEHMQ